HLRMTKGMGYWSREAATSCIQKVTASQNDKNEEILLSKLCKVFSIQTFYSGPVFLRTGESEEWMMIRKIFPSVLMLALVFQAAGCGDSSSQNCNVAGINVGPNTATANHTAAPPANSQTFSASVRFAGLCIAATAALVNSNWSASDPSVQLSASPTTMV